MENQKSILVIDDDIDLLMILRKRIEDLGFKMLTQDNYSELSKHFEMGNILFVMLDLKFNDEFKGFKFLKSIREKFNKDVPIIIISAEESTSVIAHTLELGANEYFKKPIFKAEFVELVNRYISNRKNQINEINLSVINKSYGRVRLGFDLKLIEINHSGFVFSSDTLITKGTPIKISGNEIKEIFGVDSVTVYVVNSDLIEGDNIKFKLITELDSYDSQKIEQVKVWLNRVKSGRRDNG